MGTIPCGTDTFLIGILFPESKLWKAVFWLQERHLMPVGTLVTNWPAHFSVWHLLRILWRFSVPGSQRRLFCKHWGWLKAPLVLVFTPELTTQCTNLLRLFQAVLVNIQRWWRWFDVAGWLCAQQCSGCCSADNQQQVAPKSFTWIYWHLFWSTELDWTPRFHVPNMT